MKEYNVDRSSFNVVNMLCATCFGLLWLSSDISNHKILWGKNNFQQEFSVIQWDLIFYIWNGLILYGCETWSLTLREERRLRLYVNRVLRRIFGPKRDEITWEWRKLHNKEFNELYSSPNIVWVIKSRRMRWAGHVARVGERRGV